MAKVTLYEYDGETRRENGVSVNWRELCTNVPFMEHMETFDEALGDIADLVADLAKVSWHGPWRNEHGHKCYEAETDDRPLYRAEVEE